MLKQLSEHMHMIVTEHLWCDWYCVPQWSRSTKLNLPDPLAIMIFHTTMNSFHRLCTHAFDAIAAVSTGNDGGHADVPVETITITKATAA